MIAAGHAGVFRSTDGKTWAQTKNLDGGQNYTSVGAIAFDHGTGDATHWRMAAGGGHFVAAGDKNGPGVRKTSEDGVTWHDYTDQTFSLNHIAYGGGRFVAVGSDGNKATTSTDGKTWEDTAAMGVGGYPQKVPLVLAG